MIIVKRNNMHTKTLALTFKSDFFYKNSGRRFETAGQEIITEFYGYPKNDNGKTKITFWSLDRFG